MFLRKSTLACTALVALLASCSENSTQPEDPYALISVNVQTAGGDVDDAYVVMVGSQLRVVNSTATFTMSVTPGQATVELSGIAANCAPDGSPSVSVQASRGKTATASFHVTCWQTGFQVSARSTGDDIPSFYTLVIAGDSPQHAPQLLPANASLVVSRLQPGRYTLRLEPALTSCTPTSAKEMTVDLPPRTVVPVSFEVQCSGIVRREVIAYSVDSTISAKSPTYIGLARPDGSEPGILGSGSWPSWSPDGKKLAYSDFTCVDFGSYYDYCKSVIMTVDPETLDSRVIAEGTMPAWSPKGDVVALVQTDGSLRLVPFDGSGPLRKVAIPGALLVAAPAWSPDGTMIAFECHENNKFFRLCVINSDGTGFRQLTDDTSDPVGHPAWSRDGSVIAFSSIRVAETVIATIPALGGAITTLTSGYDPAWSPDGTKLVFARAGGLFTMNRDGSNVQQLTSGTHRDPAWRP